MKQLSNDKVVLRALEPEDVELLYGWENDSDLWQVSNTLAPFSKYVLTQFIESQMQDIYQTRQMRLVIESNPTTAQSVQSTFLTSTRRIIVQVWD